MLVNRSTPLPRPLLSIQFVGTLLYAWVERGTVKVKCLAQEHNAVSRARLQRTINHYRFSWIVRALRLVNLTGRISTVWPVKCKTLILRALFQDKEI